MIVLEASGSSWDGPAAVKKEFEAREVVVASGEKGEQQRQWGISVMCRSVGGGG